MQIRGASEHNGKKIIFIYLFSMVLWDSPNLHLFAAIDNFGFPLSCCSFYFADFLLLFTIILWGFVRKDFVESLLIFYLSAGT